MDFITLAQKRCSIRSYKADAVPDEVLKQVLDAGCLAPTACNLQPFYFVVVRDSARLDGLAEAYRGPFLREAPVVIVVCTEPGVAWTRRRYDEKNYCEVDAAIAVDHMTLAAEELGLGTCWIAAFDPEIVAQVLELPAEVEPLIVLPLGYPNEVGREKVRKNLTELVRYDHW